MIIIVKIVEGIEAVIWLDVLGVLCFSPAGSFASALLFSVKEGPMEVSGVATAHGQTGLGPYEWDLTKLTFLVMVTNGGFYAVQKDATDRT